MHEKLDTRCKGVYSKMNVTGFLLRIQYGLENGGGWGPWSDIGDDEISRMGIVANLLAEFLQQLNFIKIYVDEPKRKSQSPAEVWSAKDSFISDCSHHPKLKAQGASV